MNEKSNTKLAAREAAIGIVLNPKRDGVLLVRRRDIPVYVPPGGGVDTGESPQDAVVREVQEETGLNVEIVKKVGLYHPINRLTRRTHVFECTPVSGTLTPTQEGSHSQFFPIDELPKPLAPPHIEWIADTLSSKELLIERPITSVTYLTLAKAFLLHPRITLLFLLTKVGIHLNKQ